MSTTAVEMLARQRESGQAMQPYFSSIVAWTRLFSECVFEQYERGIPRAPYTDDMWQMLADIGVEPAPRRRVTLPRATLDIGSRS